MTMLAETTIGDYLPSAVAVVIALVSGGLGVYNLRAAHRLEAQRRIETREEQIRQIMTKYRDPLLRAAFDLQSRLYNLMRFGFLERYYRSGTAAEHDYARDSTLYVLAEYFAWTEILRREVQFLDPQDVERERQLSLRVDAIGEAFVTAEIDPVFRVFRAEQRAIGELMIHRTMMAGMQVRLECVGYASFVSKLQELQFSPWFEKLRTDIELLASEPGLHEKRLVLLQHALVDLIDFLDPEFTHFPRERRMKIEPPGKARSEVAGMTE